MAGDTAYLKPSVRHPSLKKQTQADQRYPQPTGGSFRIDHSRWQSVIAGQPNTHLLHLLLLPSFSFNIPGHTSSHEEQKKRQTERECTSKRDLVSTSASPSSSSPASQLPVTHIRRCRSANTHTDKVLFLQRSCDRSDPADRTAKRN